MPTLGKLRKEVHLFINGFISNSVILDPNNTSQMKNSGFVFSTPEFATSGDK
ncbi:hypothetical protein ACFJ30_003790 [Salmonella enterica]